ncbi:MAG: hypothetical protein H0X67_24655 [Acidobacteria bacterium]|nr:hypothetical protein [Acidobacteriota bacterium]
MPLTAFQKDVLAVLAANRSEESHFAGGVLLHASDDSPRFSRDFDIFHDVALEVVRASERDVASLRGAGFTVATVSRHGEWERDTTFRRAIVRGAGALVEIDWAADSAFRFFPIERDAQLGWRLHLFDAATNKALTLAARTETRDYVDIVELAGRFPLAAICWAACGKDPGFTPLSLLKMMRRFARIDPVELDKIQARALDPLDLKARWLAISDEAEAEMTALADHRPEIPVGIAFVDASGTPGWIGGDPALRRHAPSVRGCWPQVRGLNLD